MTSTTTTRTTRTAPVTPEGAAVLVFPAARHRAPVPPRAVAGTERLDAGRHGTHCAGGPECQAAAGAVRL